MRKLYLAITCLLILTVYASILSAQAQSQETTKSIASGPVHVQVGVWIIEIQKVDLSASTYRLDFYMWFSFNPSQINASDVAQYEFVNGQPTIKQIDSSDSYLEYRVTGDFLKTFDFSDYPLRVIHSTLSLNMKTSTTHN
ncbi:MAG: hypothetical protein ACM3UN_00190 [Bacillota bacterium]